MPEVAKRGLEDASAGAHKVDATKLGVSNVETAGQMTPVCNVCWRENGSRPTCGARVCVDELLRLRTEFEVCEYDIAALREELSREFKVNTWTFRLMLFVRTGTISLT